MRTLGNAKGFTLVELAIVLVIIGIILGAVLKGQELINSAKIKRVYNQQREIFAAFYTYYDKYQRYPGDDNTVTGRPGFAGLYSAGDGNGLIEGVDDTTMFTCPTTSPAASEGCGLWEHLRAANIITGSAPTNPSNSYGGAIGVGYVAVQGLTANWIGFSSVPPDVAQALDTQNDDGVYNTGSIRTTAASYAGPTPISLFFKL